MSQDGVPQSRFLGGTAAVLIVVALLSAGVMFMAAAIAPPPVDVRETPPAMQQAAEPVPGV